MEIPHNWRIPLRALAIAAALGWTSFVLHAGLELGGSGLDELFNAWIYNGLMLLGSAVCLLRAVAVPEARAAWAVMGFGLLSWTAGEVYWSLELSQLDAPPFPSLADALYLSFYPASYVALLLLVRSRVRGLPGSRWLDGGIAALAVAALAAAVALGPIVEGTTGDAATVATNLAYPLGDLLLLGLVICIFGLSGWRSGRTWMLLGGGLFAHGRRRRRLPLPDRNRVLRRGHPARYALARRGAAETSETTPQHAAYPSTHESSRSRIAPSRSTRGA